MRVVPRLRDCVIYLYCYLARARARERESALHQALPSMSACARNKNKLTFFSRPRIKRALRYGTRKKKWDRKNESRGTILQRREPLTPREERRGNRESRRRGTPIWRSARSDPGQNGGEWKARGGKATADRSASRSRALVLRPNPRGFVRRVWTIANEIANATPLTRG